MPGVEAITARNSAGYDAPIGLTADPVVFTLAGERLSVLLARRLEEPQRGSFALPGGFVGAEETPAQTAERKLREKTGVGSVHLEQLRTYAEPGRDPRGWLPSVAYLALVRPEALPEEGGPEGREAGWFPVDDLPELALDHETIVDDGLWRLRARVAEKTWFLRVAGALLTEQLHARPGAAPLRGAARRRGRRRELPPRRQGDRAPRRHRRGALGRPGTPGPPLPSPLSGLRAGPRRRIRLAPES